jgi:hypothetical protein
MPSTARRISDSSLAQSMAGMRNRWPPASAAGVGPLATASVAPQQAPQAGGPATLAAAGWVSWEFLLIMAPLQTLKWV